METRFGPKDELRFRTRSAGLPNSLGKLKAGRSIVYNPTNGKETTANSADVFSSGSVGQGPAVEERCWDALHSGPPFRDGGPFAHIRIERPNFTIQGGGTWECGVYEPRPTLNQRYTGGFFDPLWLSTWDTAIGAAILNFKPGAVSTQFNPSNLSSLGDAAYNRLRPKIEVAGLAQAVAEARDIPRMLRTTAKGLAQQWSNLKSLGGYKVPLESITRGSKPKELGDQYLNFMFGWKPFVKDVNDVCRIVVNGHDIIERKKAQNDKWQRRSFYEDEIRSETVIYTAGITGVAPVTSSSGIGRIVQNLGKSYTVTLEEIERTWYQGEFKFYYPEFDSNHWTAGYPSLQRVMQYAAISGLKMDPVLLYKLIPYTWLVDWFAGVGGSLQRLQDMATDSVVSKYFYIMRQRTFRYRLRSQFVTSLGSHDYSWYYGGTAKMRSAGSSPFGFNLTTGNLTGTQLSILGALGLSKWKP